MLKPGRLQQTAEQMLETNLQIVVLQEIRRKGYGKIKKDKYIIYYSCAEDNTGYAGTGFIMRKDIDGSVLGFEPYNKHLCRLRIRGKFHNITIISAYAPTEDKDEALKEQVYGDLKKLQDKVPRNHLLIIAGDFNAKVGTESAYKGVVGKYSIHPISNLNREYLCNHAISNNLTIASTQFQHKRTHIGIWTSPAGQTVNQIYHVLVNKMTRGIIQDVRMTRGPKSNSDHFLLKIRVKQRLIISQMKKHEQIRWNPENLHNKQKIYQYTQLLHHKLQDKHVQQNINKEWINIKDAILEAAMEIITKKQAIQRNTWWAEECRKAIKQ
jgi:hypothetical protein